MNNYYIDIHCHPSLKPYGKSFTDNSPGNNSASRKQKNSLWYYNPPTLADKLTEYITGIAKFTQSDAAALSYGSVHVVCASLYPIEQCLFVNKAGTGIIGDALDNFVSGVGNDRVKYVQQRQDYFSDLKSEYEYYKQLHNSIITIDQRKYRYVIAANYSELASYLQNPLPDVTTLCFLITIEGMHSLDTGLQNEPDEKVIFKHLEEIKQWSYRPCFVTFAHHFWNQLCGHSRSLTEKVIDWVTNQEIHMDEGFTALGEKVRDAILDNSEGKRILIDIKHMSALSRSQYIQYLKDKQISTGEIIPVIISHGAANGRRSFREPNVVDITDTGFNLMERDINFYDEEIVFIAKSSGLFGLQLDERRIASEAYLKYQVKHSPFRNKIMHYRSYLLWQQVQHIAELLNTNNLFAWDVLCIGSDYDGIINTLNSFWTEEEMPQLADFFERHAFNYMEAKGKTRLSSFNQLGADEITARIFRENAMKFLKLNFH